MPPNVVSAAGRRQSVTPNATMTTLASPTHGGTARLSLWQVTMAAGSQGPLHTMTSEQVWTVVTGAAEIALNGTAHRLVAGDTLALPGGVDRQITANGEVTFLVCGASDALAITAANPAGVIPPWIQ